ncbi:NlpC/P60 family protein [Gracilibacillus xinjiangensis]|uniref:NlpC/P60 family protein n=1 Tax=Gracilibacillus xinjiangensis TaxID=1193282 RepID=A0ABV8WZK2_9BACI
MLLHDQLSTVVKHSVAYSFAFSQPFSFYVDAYPIVQSQILEQATVLSFGVHHDSVRILQHKLQKLSYYDSSIDGKFGALTEFAVKQFQKDQQIKISGEADSQTIQKLIKLEADSYEGILSEQITSEQNSSPEEVEQLQVALQYYGYYEAEIDGIYGPKTDAALQAYKQDKGLQIVHIENEAFHDVSNSPTIQPEPNNTYENNVEPTSNHTVENEAAEAELVQVTTHHIPDIVGTAKAYQGIPYVWGGTTTAGFDCSGYIQYVFKQLNIHLPRTVNEMWNATQPLDQPAIGDIVFFETYKPGPSHAGIYIGNRQFIHAGASNGVEISTLDQPYWSERYLGAKRVVSE